MKYWNDQAGPITMPRRRRAPVDPAQPVDRLRRCVVSTDDRFIEIDYRIAVECHERTLRNAAGRKKTLSGVARHADDVHVGTGNASRHMALALSCNMKKGARTFTASMWSNSSGEVSRMLLRSVRPAQL